MKGHVEVEAMEGVKAQVKEEVKVKVDLVEGDDEEEEEEDQIYPMKFMQPLSTM